MEEAHTRKLRFERQWRKLETMEERRIKLTVSCAWGFHFESSRSTCSATYPIILLHSIKTNQVENELLRE